MSNKRHSAQMSGYLDSTARERSRAATKSSTGYLYPPHPPPPPPNATTTTTTTKQTHTASDPTTTSTTTNPPQPAKKPRRRRLQTYNICHGCRTAESDIRLSHALNSLGTAELAPLDFCDGGRPACARCHTADRRCAYDETPLTPLAIDDDDNDDPRDLRYQLECRTRDFARLLLLLRTLHQGSDAEASLVLARLRMGEDVGSVIARVTGRDGLGDV